MFVCFFSSYAMDLPLLPTLPIHSTETLLQSLFTSIQDFTYEKTDTLIKKYPKLVHLRYKDSKSFYARVTPLHCAAKAGNVKALELILNVSKEPINDIAGYYGAPLHQASTQNVVEILLRNGAYIDQPDKEGFSFLYKCLFEQNDYEMARFLLENGANSNQRIRGAENLLYHAMSKNTPAKVAKLLLRYGANPYVPTAGCFVPPCGITAWSKFNYYSAHCSVKRKLFENVGRYELYCNKPGQDPFYLLLNDAFYFNYIMTNSNNRNTSKGQAKKRYTCAILMELFSILNKTENHRRQGRAIANPIKEKPITIVDMYPKKYLLNNPSFADLQEIIPGEGVTMVRKYFKDINDEMVHYCHSSDWSIETILKEYPFVFYYDTKIAFHIVGACIQQKKNLDVLDTHQVDISGRDAEGNSLLHMAVLSENADAIQWLINKKIDCSLQNNEGKTAIDYLKKCGNQECQNAFNVQFSYLFTLNKLSKNNEELVPTKDFCGIQYLDEGEQTLFLQVLHMRPEKVLFFLQKGTYLNTKNNEGISPLASLIKSVYTMHWHEIPQQKKYLIRLLLDYNAVVDKVTIHMVQDPYLKQLLQNAYDNHYCFSCGKHPQELSHFMCCNAYRQLVCKVCYDELEQVNNKCPLCKQYLAGFC